MHLLLAVPIELSTKIRAAVLVIGTSMQDVGMVKLDYICLFIARRAVSISPPRGVYHYAEFTA